MFRARESGVSLHDESSARQRVAIDKLIDDDRRSDSQLLQSTGSANELTCQL